QMQKLPNEFVEQLIKILQGARNSSAYDLATDIEDYWNATLIALEMKDKEKVLKGLQSCSNSQIISHVINSQLDSADYFTKLLAIAKKKQWPTEVKRLNHLLAGVYQQNHQFAKAERAYLENNDPESAVDMYISQKDTKKALELAIDYELANQIHQLYATVADNYHEKNEYTAELSLLKQTQKILKTLPEKYSSRLAKLETFTSGRKFYRNKEFTKSIQVLEPNLKELSSEIPIVSLSTILARSYELKGEISKANEYYKVLEENLFTADKEFVKYKRLRLHDGSGEFSDQTERQIFRKLLNKYSNGLFQSVSPPCQVCFRTKTKVESYFICTLCERYICLECQLERKIDICPFCKGELIQKHQRKQSPLFFNCMFCEETIVEFEIYFQCPNCRQLLCQDCKSRGIGKCPVCNKNLNEINV
ncbi:MAG: tetratricopeptide repeat protein, partial [Candidatus Hodarchaeota archaeon]